MNEVVARGSVLQSRYRIVKEVGRGGMGAVYEAFDLRLEHTVAVKQILRTHEKLWKDFEREARLLARLNHPALPRVTDYFVEGNRAFFVMQFIDGCDMGNLIAERSGPFPRNAVIVWADQLLDALMYLHSHERQIIHRDIKPHNLKITKTGQLALLDFGLAKRRPLAPFGENGCHSIRGYTPSYAPLEQIQNQGTSPQTDIYALGATLYHLITGVKPADSVTRATALLNARPNPLRPADQINPAAGRHLAEILERAMSQSAADRFGSAREFREALRKVGRVPAVESAGLWEDSRDGLPTREKIIIEFGNARGKAFGAGAFVTLVIVLLTLFGVCCSFYHWKLPETPRGGIEKVRTD